MNRAIPIGSALIVVAIIGAIVVVTDRYRAAPDLAGQWKSWRSEFRIYREGDLYKIVVNNPSGLLGGTYTGKFRDDALLVNGPLAPLCSEIKYSKSTDKLEFCGEEFVRVRRE